MKLPLILFIICFAIFQSCDKAIQYEDKFTENTPEGLIHWNVLKVEGPSTSLVNQPVTLEVTYPTSSGCDYVSKFVTVLSGNEILVKAYGNSIKNTPCTTAAIPKKIYYEFTPSIKGQFVFKFINKDNSIISHPITFN